MIKIFNLDKIKFDSMIKNLINYILCATLILGGNMEEKTILEYLQSPSSVEIIVDNNTIQLERLDSFLIELNKMLDNSQVMPAFGVSIHNHTVQALKKGIWLKFIYKQTNEAEGMFFDELIIEVQPKYSGFNIIRGNKGKYEGRCYYINLVGKDMSNVYNYIQNSIK